MSYYGNPPPGNTFYYGGVHPQFSRATTQHGLPPPPPPPPPPPSFGIPKFPPGPPPPSDIYRFQGDSWRPDGGHNIQQQNEFSFRSNHNGPQYPGDADYYPRPTRSNTYAMNEQRHSRSEGVRGPGQDGHSGGRDDQRGFVPNRGRGYRPRTATANRPLLRFQRGTTPEQLLEMAEDQRGSKRFLPAEDLSDSAEEDMDESESDQYQEIAMSGQTLPVSTEAADGGAETVEPPAKRQAREPAANAQNEGARVPQWSNPDPYTVLPPPDETQRRKKDVVKLIRKARIVSGNMSSAQSQVATNDDFISFGFNDDLGPEQEHVIPSDKEQIYDKGVPGAPSGPRQFSHLQNLHGQIPINAPGTDGPLLSANSLGPPPCRGLSAPAQPQSTSRNDWARPDVGPPVDPVLPAKILGQHHISPPNKPQEPIRGAWPPIDVNAALGTRKRTHDDAIKDDPPRPPKRGLKDVRAMKGRVIPEWMWKPNSAAIPWLVQDHRETENQGFRLHKEICDFYDFVKPKPFEQAMREDLLERLRQIVKGRFPNSDVHCFGSFAAGLYLPNADIDVAVISDGFLNRGSRTVCQSKSQMYSFADHLRNVAMAEHDSIEVIAKAKVPLIKFVDRFTGLRVDISFENNTGLIANNTFDHWKRQFPAMPILVTVIKQFLMMRGLNEVVNGGLGGFSVTCLVTSLLQNMPRVQSGEIIPEHHLGEMLMEFLDFYGNQLDITRTGISLNPPGYFDKRRSNGSTYRAYKIDRLAIMDPNRPDNDISGGSRNVVLIFDRFAQAHQEILEAMSDASRLSLLDWMLGGKYDSFDWQRNRLRELYTAQRGEPDIDSFQPSIANHPLPDHHLHFNNLHDTGSSGLALPSGVGDRSNSQPRGVPDNPFGSSQPPAKKAKTKAATAAKAGLTPHTSSSTKPKPNQQNQQNKQKKAKATAPVAVQAPQATKPPQPKKLDVAYKARARAVHLRRQYPDMKNVPATISKALRATFIANYTATRGVPTKKPIKPKRVAKPVAEPVAKPVAKPVAEASARRSQRLAVQSTTTPPDGTSKRNPIAIDGVSAYKGTWVGNTA